MKYKLPAIPTPAIIILFWFFFAPVDPVFQRHVILPGGRVGEKWNNWRYFSLLLQQECCLRSAPQLPPPRTESVGFLLPRQLELISRCHPRLLRTGQVFLINKQLGIIGFQGHKKGRTLCTGEIKTTDGTTPARRPSPHARKSPGNWRS